MYCTQCNIAFSWKTGEIESGVIHNPHFYEYQRQAGLNIRNPVEVPCGGIPRYYLFNIRLEKAVLNKKVSTHNRRLIMSFHREANHWQHWEIRQIRRQCMTLDDNLQLRIVYLMNDLDEEDMKKELIKREKSKNKKTSMLHIYELMNTVFTESLIDIYNNCVDENFERNLNRIRKLIIYSNKELARISYVFGQTVKCFDHKSLRLYATKYNKKTYNLLVK